MHRVRIGPVPATEVRVSGKFTITRTYELRMTYRCHVMLDAVVIDDGLRIDVELVRRYR